MAAHTCPSNPCPICHPALDQGRSLAGHATSPSDLSPVGSSQSGIANAGHFPRIVTHEQALDAAIDLINHYFGNERREHGGVYISVPARPDNTDIVLTDYIKQQRAATSDHAVGATDAPISQESDDAK